MTTPFLFSDPIHAVESEVLDAMIQAASVSQVPPWKPLKESRIGNTAIIPIQGAIDSQLPNAWWKPYVAASHEIVPQIEAAMKDESVEKIVLLVNTPGGTVKAAEEFAKAVEKAASIKQVETFIDGGCYSAGVWITAHSHRIIAAPMSYIGSVGVIARYFDTSKYFEDVGIKSVAISTGEMKKMGLPGEPITEQMKQDVSGRITRLGERFKNILIEKRGIPKAKVDLIAANASYWPAEEAIELGLIDTIQTWDEYIAGIPGTTTEPSKSLEPKGENKMSENTTTQVDPKALMAKRKTEIEAKCQGAPADFVMDAMLSDKPVDQIALEYQTKRASENEVMIAELKSQIAAQKEQANAPSTENNTPKVIGCEPVGMNVNANRNPMSMEDYDSEVRTEMNKLIQSGHDRASALSIAAERVYMRMSEESREKLFHSDFNLPPSA